MQERCRENDIGSIRRPEGGESMLQYLGLLDILWAIWQSIFRKNGEKLTEKVEIKEYNTIQTFDGPDFHSRTLVADQPEAKPPF